MGTTLGHRNANAATSPLAIDADDLVATPARTDRGFALAVRGRHMLVIDILAAAIGCYLALALRLDRPPGPIVIAASMGGLLVPLLVRPVINWRLGLYRRMWSYASVPDLIRVAQAGVIGTVMSVLIFYIALVPLNAPGTEGFPRSFWLIELLLALAFQGGARFGIRVLSERRPSRYAGEPSEVQPVLLFGAGRVGAMIARSALRDPGAGVRPVGFLDDDPRLAGQSIAGIRVLGDLSQLKQAVAATGARAILITMASAQGERIRDIMDAAAQLRLSVRTVPPMHELLDGSIDAYRARSIRIDDLLSRPVATDHGPGVAAMIDGGCVMITGAGGSIGSELARQVHALRPRKVVLVDRAESPLYSVQRELEVRALQGRGGGEVVTHLGNVASRVAMAHLVKLHRPTIVFHAAAYKHVPMMESYPSEGVHVNIGGTMSMLDASRAAGVQRFVLVSTDKAVEPSSVMGATKRISEALVVAAARDSSLPYISVRFGNVLGSAGSVLPIFMSQLEHGQPLTVTHPDMTRFFMTISEAVWLILDAASIGRPGDLFVLDMGEPVKIMDLCRDLIRLSGRRPDSVPIQITGLRPGEKLHEQLFYSAEHIEQTEVPKIMRAAHATEIDGVREMARELLAMATGADDDALVQRLFFLAREVNGKVAAAPTERAVPAAAITNGSAGPMQRHAGVPMEANS